MLAWQEVGDLVDVASIAGAAKYIPVQWKAYLLQYEKVLVAYDNDEAGNVGAERLIAESKRCTRVIVPQGNDLTDFYLAGGNLRDWISFVLKRSEIQSSKKFITSSSLELNKSNTDVSLQNMVNEESDKPTEKQAVMVGGLVLTDVWQEVPIELLVPGGVAEWIDLNSPTKKVRLATEDELANAPFWKPVWKPNNFSFFDYSKFIQDN